MENRKMATLPQAANTEGNNEQMGFTPLPEDEYQMQIVESFFKDTKDKNGQYLQLNMVVTDGEYENRKYIERLNLVNSNPIAVEIANKTLNSICEACGLRGVEDSEELHNIEFIAVMTIQDSGNSKYGPQNSIREYKSLDQGSPFMDED